MKGVCSFDGVHQCEAAQVCAIPSGNATIHHQETRLTLHWLAIQSLVFTEKYPAIVLMVGRVSAAVW